MDVDSDKSIEIIAAVAENLAIGKDGQMPWHLPQDLKHFKSVTMGHTVLMGRRTFESIGRPLPGRDNIVLTSRGGLTVPGVVAVSGLEEALAACRTATLMVIGGQRVYEEMLPHARVLHLTRIMKSFEGDTFFPDWQAQPFVLKDRSEVQSSQENGFEFCFESWERRPGF